MVERPLRYSSCQAMPPALRRRVLKQRAGAPEAPTLPASPPAPRRDLEHIEQVVFFNRIRTLALNEPRYAVAVRRTFAIPNGGGRTKREAGRLKAEGVLSGVSDIFCSVARADLHGLYIEMKSTTGRPTPQQIAWIKESEDQGYGALICHGADEAFQAWRRYVDGNSNFNGLLNGR